MKLYIRVEGANSVTERISIVQKTLPVLKSHNILMDGGFSFNTNYGVTFIRVNQFMNIVEMSGLPSMWIFGLDKDEWSDDMIHQLETDIETATRIPATVIS